MRSLMRVSSVEIAPPVALSRRRENDGGRMRSVHRRTGSVPDDLQRTGLGAPWGLRPVGTDRSSLLGVYPEGGTGNPTSHRLCTREDTSVSSLWTPSGEHRPAEEPAEGPGPGGGPPPGAAGEREPTPEEVEALREVHARLVATPVVDVVANHALGIWQLALVHLGVITPPDEQGRPPAPDLAAAGFAIDAMAALVDGLGERLGDHEAVLRDALTQAQMLFVEISEPGPESGS